MDELILPFQTYAGKVQIEPTYETMTQLPSWPQPRRVVLGRRLQGVIPAQQSGQFWDTYKHEYEAYITDLPVKQANNWQIVDLYRKRADCENGNFRPATNNENIGS